MGAGREHNKSRKGSESLSETQMSNYASKRTHMQTKPLTMVSLLTRETSLMSL